MENFDDTDRPIPWQPRGRQTPHPRQAGFRRILVPLDFSVGTQDTLRYAKAFAERADAVLDLLHVVQLNIAGEEKSIPRTNLIRGLSEAAHLEMKKIIDIFLDGEAVTTVSVREGRPVETILREAAATRADLIIMGGRRRSFWTRLLRPGVLTRVLRRASCPVMVVPAANDL
jgi:universal stress protein A